MGAACGPGGAAPRPGWCRRWRKGRDLVIIGDLGRALARAGGERGGREEKDGHGGQSAHWALSLDQLMAWT